MVIFHIKLKGITKYSSMVANILPTDPYSYPLLTLRLGSVGRNSTFSEHGFVAYQIKENHKCSNTVANLLSADRPTPPPPPPDPGDGANRSKIQHFQNMVMLYIKLNGITKCSNMVANILPADPLPLRFYVRPGVIVISNCNYL